MWHDEPSGESQQSGGGSSPDMAVTLTKLVGQQHGLQGQLSEMFCMMKYFFEQQEALKKELIADISERLEKHAHHKHALVQHFLDSQKTPGKNEVTEEEPPKSDVCGSPETPGNAAESGLTSKDSDPNASTAGSRDSAAARSSQGNSGNGKQLLGITGSSGSQLHLEIPDAANVRSLKAWKSCISSIVEDEKFELLLTGLIVANAVVMTFVSQYSGIQVGYDLQYPGSASEAKKAWPAADIIFSILDWSFGIAFLVEALLKLSCFGSDYLIGGWHSAWNWLDVVCVIAFLFEKVASAVLPFDSQGLRLLRLMRLFRLLRVLRAVEALDVLYVMATAIKGMGRILAWAVVLLAMLLATCALFLSQLLHATYFKNAVAASMSQPDLETHQEMFKYFGTFTRCLLSMFELTLANWPPVTRLLVEHVSEWFTLMCLLHKLTIGFAVIGVINGVILQETFKVAATDDVIMVRQKRRMAQVTRQKMTKLFTVLDTTGDGDLEFDEFELIAQDPEVKTWLASMDIETDDLATLFKLLDSDGSGSINVEEMLERIPRVKGAARSIDVLALRATLNEFLQRECGRPSDPVNIGGSYSVIPDLRKIGTDGRSRD
jgi:hypothetical protein